MKNSLLLFCLIFSLNLQAQYAPATLSLGLDQVLFKKGLIDVEVLAELVSDKQNELKGRIIEQAILKPISKNSSFVTRNYVFSVVKELMNEKDKNILKKELLEHTINYSLVYSLSEMYVQLSWDKLRKDQGYINELIGIQNDSVSMDYRSVSKFHRVDFPSFKLGLSDSLYIHFKGTEDSVNFNQLVMDMVFHATRNNPVLIEKGFFNKPMYFNLDQYRTESTYQTLINQELKLKMYNNIRDFVNEISLYYKNFSDLSAISKNANIKQNDYLKEINNNYLKLKQKVLNSSIENEMDNLDEDLNKDKLRLVDNWMTTFNYKGSIDADALLEYISTNNISELKKLGEKDTTYWTQSYQDFLALNIVDIYYLMDSEQLIKEYRQELKDTSKYIDDTTAAAIFENLIRRIDQEFSNLANDETSIFLKTSDYDSALTQILDFYYYIKTNHNSATSSYYIDKLNSEIIPKLAYLNLKSNGKTKVLIEHMEDLVVIMKYQIFKPLIMQSDTGHYSPQFKILISENNKMMPLHLNFFKKLDELDEMKTYYYLIHDILMAGEQAMDRDVANAMNCIFKSIEKYTDFDEVNDKIDIDVESIILALYEKYGERDRNPLHFYFTLGLNNAYNLYKPDPSGLETLPISNFSFAGEKIGLRFNLYNFELRNSYAQGEKRPWSAGKFSKKNYLKDPIVSNIHLLVFGSGLLYQIADLTTEKNINATFLGTGLGIQFFNKLNFNTSLLFPVFENQNFEFKTPMLNIGFDVYFVEYLTALNKKRKDRQQQKDQLELEKAKLMNE